MKQLNPYVTFQNNCREAMTFYKDCLGGELMMQTVGESPVAAQMPPEMKDKIMHSALRVNGNVVLMSSDMIMSGEFVSGNTVTLCVVCSSKVEIETFFAKFSVGAKVTQPLKEEFFGTFGSLTDKFGVYWMFQYGDEVKM
jgi:PhnB protein